MKSIKFYQLFLLGSILSCSPSVESEVETLAKHVDTINTNRASKTAKEQYGVWTTNESGSKKLAKTTAINFSGQVSGRSTIEVDSRSTNRAQYIDGFGYTLTGGSAELIYKLNSTEQSKLLNEFFNNTSVEYPGMEPIKNDVLRIAIGGEDLSRTAYTYNDLAAGQQDLTLSKFSLSKDLEYKIPILKKIVAINPQIKIIATPWSAPAWMKTNNSLKGGRLKPDSNNNGNQIYYEAYAKYFVKYIQEMKKQGITIYAVTPQNEPLNENNNPSMRMDDWEQVNFIKYHLGPQLRNASLNVKIIGFDHNANNAGVNYAKTLLNDNVLSQYLSGTAWHLYGDGNDASYISNLSTIRNFKQDKGIYFTEQWLDRSSGSWNWGDFIWHIENITVGSLNNWSKTAMEWNLASDPNTSIHTPGGCTNCLGAVTINNNTITRNSTYYSIAHASRFLGDNAQRLLPKPTNVSGLTYVAFVNDQAPYARVMILVNSSSSRRDLNLKYTNYDGVVKYAPISIEGKNVQTYVWQQ